MGFAAVLGRVTSVRARQGIVGRQQIQIISIDSRATQQPLQSVGTQSLLKSGRSEGERAGCKQIRKRTYTAAMEKSYQVR